MFACPSGDVNPAELEVSYLRSMGTRLDPFNRNVGGVNALLVDGSVRFVSDTIDGAAWRELGSRNSDDDFDRF